MALREQYDDGGISGGTLDRPALNQLLEDVEDGLIDVVVVYKIDRLSRSLMDFSKLVEVFDRNNVTFISVTQSFNTTTSMGRLTLNILLSFAQFEREVTAERIRDKVAASRKKGMWMGGCVPHGYDVKNRKLVINPDEAKAVRQIFERFVQLGSASHLARELRAEGFQTKRGMLNDKGYIYRILKNRVYLGEAVHKGVSYPGEHEAIISQELWDKVRSIMQRSPRERGDNSRGRTPALLKGLVFTASGVSMTPSGTLKGNRWYRYYVSMDKIKDRDVVDDGAPKRLSADTLESAVLSQLRKVLRAPETAAHALASLKSLSVSIDERDVVAALQDFDELWGKLFPLEQARIAQLLLRRVTVTAQGLVIDIRTEAIGGVIQDLITPTKEEAA